MQQIYRYDLKKLVRRLMPVRWRNPRNLNWYECLLSGMNYSMDRFEAYKEDALRRLSYNGQTCYLEKFLNDVYDNTQRRIQIKHDESSGVFWYNEDEGQAPIYIYNESESGTTYLYNEGEDFGALPDGIDFRIVAPASLSSKESQMRADVKKYALAGKTFDFVFA
ncbi:hypothetical protein WBG78_28410 [Chryseolinea sp. T2]|uniref:hypothetical protein n=1 Tax=Chryseolinea sp. T2 TaxID=3129255 RepID=UPI00307770B3